MATVCFGSGCIRFRNDAPPTDAGLADASEREAANGRDADLGDASGDAAPPPICERFDPSIADTIAENIVAELTGDCRINAYFVGLPALRVEHFVQCLAFQMGSAMGCVRPDGVKVKYPAFDSEGKICADMRTAHTAFQTSDGDFDAFISDMVAAMERAGLTTDEITRLTRAYGTTRNDIVRLRDAGPTRPCDAGSSGVPSDARRDGT